MAAAMAAAEAAQRVAAVEEARRVAAAEAARENAEREARRAGAEEAAALEASRRLADEEARALADAAAAEQERQMAIARGRGDTRDHAVSRLLVGVPRPAPHQLKPALGEDGRLRHRRLPADVPTGRAGQQAAHQVEDALAEHVEEKENAAVGGLSSCALDAADRPAAVKRGLARVVLGLCVARKSRRQPLPDF